eukprot:m.163412 g.163412  ORF g.163412 m.163412 type:complete len:1330 (-) comp12303_c0_seq1:1503-5492(-)
MLRWAVTVTLVGANAVTAQTPQPTAASPNFPPFPTFTLPPTLEPTRLRATEPPSAVETTRAPARALSTATPTLARTTQPTPAPTFAPTTWSPVPNVPPTTWAPWIAGWTPATTCDTTLGRQYVQTTRYNLCFQCNALALVQLVTNLNGGYDLLNGGYNFSQLIPCPIECVDSAESDRFETLSDCLGLVSQESSLEQSRINDSSTDENVTATFNLGGTPQVGRGVRFYRQNTDRARDHLLDSDDSGGRQLVQERFVVVGESRSQGGGRRQRRSLADGQLAIAYTLATRDYSMNKTVDTVDGAAGSLGSHINLAFAANEESTPIAPYPSSYNFLGPQIESAGVIFPNNSVVAAVEGDVTFSLSVDAPDGFWVRPDTGEIMISTPNVIGNVTFALLANYPGVAPVVLRLFDITIMHRDVNLPQNGPNGYSCANDGAPTDYTEFDNSFFCTCSVSGDFVGSNCADLSFIQATSVTLGGGDWSHFQTRWAAEKPYIIDPPLYDRIAIMPQNTTVTDADTSIWWEIRCETFTNLRTGNSVNRSTTPDGVFIDTTTGRLSVAFEEDQVGIAYTGCALRIFFTQRNFLPFIVVPNMNFTVMDPDFGKARLVVVNFTFGQSNAPDGVTRAFPNQTNWTIGETYTIPPLESVFLRARSDDDDDIPLDPSVYAEVQYVLKTISGPVHNFFIKSDTGEMTGSTNNNPSLTRLQIRITHPDFLDAIVSPMTVRALFADTDDRSNAVGPNGRDCAESRLRIDDEFLYDGVFQCNCTGFINTGDNCDEPRAEAHKSDSTDNTASMTVIGVAVAVIVIVAIFAAVQLYQKRQAYIKLMQPVDFTEQLERLAAAGFVHKTDKDPKPRELDRRSIEPLVELGSGNFGEVWSGTWTEDRRSTINSRKSGISRHNSTLEKIPVAIKMLKRDTPDANDEFLREASVTWQFDHENVVKMYGVVTSGAPYLLILELCSHGELKSYLQSGDPDDEDHYALGRLFHFLVGIAEGMNHLIQCGYVHRDLAARNVLIGDNFEAKICDFGLGRETADEKDYYQTDNANMLVPIRWTDPDVLGTGRFSEYTDVWAYGITAMEIFTRGETPYRGWLNTFVIEQTKNGYRMPCPEGCPEEVYNSVIFPCWLPSDENASPRRPNFSILCAELARLGAKIDPRKRTQSTEAVQKRDTMAARKKNQAYVSADAPSPSTDPASPQGSEYYEYSQHAPPPSEMAGRSDSDASSYASPSKSGFYEVPVSGGETPQSGGRPPALTSPAATDGNIKAPPQLYSFTDRRRSSAGSITWNAALLQEEGGFESAIPEESETTPAHSSNGHGTTGKKAPTKNVSGTSSMTSL